MNCAQLLLPPSREGVATQICWSVKALLSPLVGARCLPRWAAPDRFCLQGLLRVVQLVGRPYQLRVVR